MTACPNCGATWSCADWCYAYQHRTGVYRDRVACLAQNLKDAAALCKAYWLGELQWVRGDRRSAWWPGCGRSAP